MIGIDILAIKDFGQKLKIGGEAFMRRAYTESELTNKNPQHLAGIFCAKEAVLKATGLAPGDWQRITISYADNGKPLAHVDGQPINISISHNGDYAVAVAVNLP